MKSAAQVNRVKVSAIGFQKASVDIWDTKYRLKTKLGEVVDETMDDTYQRVARALAEVEPEHQRDQWYESFLWALRSGAVPAGRIVSNAGARHHKPATSTINCTVSGIIGDSMHDILDKVHEAGLTLKAGCGIGYEFSTLRPKGAYVSGAGAYTSGPLSFMDIYDKMCFTVSSAGGRRGAQMGTFDVGHPDVLDFIRAKREDGRLRQFNLSLLITDDFVNAVRANGEWALAFPIDQREYENSDIDLEDPEEVLWRDWPANGYVTNDAGQVACKIFRKLPARRLWDMIMASTYDFAEPGFVLVDRVNEMNNNWFCENIRATNPCVTADTWVQTAAGPRQVADLTGQGFTAVLDGEAWESAPEGFFQTGVKPVVRLETAGGFSLRLTADHRLRRVVRFEGEATETDWREAGDLKPGDRVLLHDHREHAQWSGAFGREEGYLIGLLHGGAGQLSAGDASICLSGVAIAANADSAPLVTGTSALMSEAENAARALVANGEGIAWQPVAETGQNELAVRGLGRVAAALGLREDPGALTAGLEKTSSRFYQGFLRAAFDLGGELVLEGSAGPAIRYTDARDDALAGIQRMLLRLGMVARRSGQRSSAVTGSCLWISGSNVAQFAARVGFSDATRQQRLADALEHPAIAHGTERFVARVKAVVSDGAEAVFDCQVPGINAFDANGIWAHNCGEQPLPPYGSCLLGSVNLTKFVLDPFTENARFDWDEFRKVVKIFTRMLDNVVEINGLPLAGQREEIFRKRRHGMGFLGLGSTVTMLRMKYGSENSVEFTETVARELALAGWQTGLELARE